MKGRPASRRDRREWLALGLLLLVLSALLVSARLTTHRAIDAAQRDQLEHQVAGLERVFTVHLGSTRQAMQSVRDHLLAWDPADRAREANRQFRTIGTALAGLGKMQWLAADGRIAASSRDDEVGRDGSAGDTFRHARSRPDPALLMVSPPIRTGPDVYSIELVIPLTGADGAFAGVISATLDSTYFATVLASAVYAPDMRAAVVHGGGVALAYLPPDPLRQGTNLDRPGSLFNRFREIGATSLVVEGALVDSSEPRLVAIRRMQPPALAMDTPLVLAVSRPVAAVFEVWRNDTVAYAVLFSACAAAACGFLWAFQRRRAEQHEHETAARARKVTDDERLELALRGADLALWDHHVPSGRVAVNARWHSMLGHAPHAVSADARAWETLLHPDDRERVLRARDDHIAGLTPSFDVTYRMRHASGEWIWIVNRGRVVERDAAGRAIRMVGTNFDATQLIEAEEALRRSEQSLAITLQSIGDGVIATDTAGIVTRVNAAAEALTGWRAAEAVGQPLATIFHIVDARTRAALDDPARRVLERGVAVDFDDAALLVARDGSVRAISDSAAPIKDAEGAIAGVVLVFSDVSRHRAAVAALRESEHQLLTLTAALPGPIARFDRAGRYLFTNATCERWFGDPAAARLGRDWHDVFPASVVAVLEPHMAAALGGTPATFDMVLPTLAGERHAMVSIVPDRDADGAIQGCIASLTDVTDRKRAEEALRQSEERSRSLLYSLRSGVIIHAADTTVVDVNPSACRILGSTRETLLSLRADRPAWRYFDDEDREIPPPLLPIVQVQQTGEPVNDRMLGVRRPGASVLWLLCSAFAVREPGGALQQIVSTFVDITERRQAAAAVEAAQRELAATLAAVPDLLFDVDLDGRIHQCHSPPSLRHRVDPSRAAGRRVADVFPADAAAVVMAALEEAHAQGHSAGRQYEIAERSGRQSFELSVSGKPASGGEPPRFILLARDVSERRQHEAQRLMLERQLREAQKMESIGTLAGGIAHDFNNILAAILGNLALAREDLPADHPAQATLGQIGKAGVRARSLVQQILTFSRRQPNPLRPRALRPIVEETLGLLRATLPASVRLEGRFTDGDLVVSADATQLQQVVMNLCTNAWQALPDHRGRIAVGLEPLDADARIADLGGDGPWAHLWVADDGTGMDAITRERIFDPFFTTKPVGQGTGLGLSVVHGIVRSHHGIIAVDTALGEGSTFHVYLPLVGNAEGREIETGHAPLAPAPARERDPAGSDGGEAHLLYVDDDEVMVLMVQRLLQRGGFRVTACASALAALELVVRPESDFDLVVSDFNMPEMSGLELADRLGRLRPELPIIITSGYVTDELRDEARTLGVRALLQKEHTLEDLAGLVRRVLAGATLV